MGELLSLALNWRCSGAELLPTPGSLANSVTPAAAESSLREGPEEVHPALALLASLAARVACRAQQAHQEHPAQGALLEADLGYSWGECQAPQVPLVHQAHQAHRESQALHLAQWMALKVKSLE